MLGMFGRKEEERSLKADRQKCHDARDIYFKCLDENEGATKKCIRSMNDLYNECPQSWADHFIRKYHLAKYKKKLEAEASKNNVAAEIIR